jgi:uncharacterized protein (DUF1330 family)
VMVSLARAIDGVEFPSADHARRWYVSEDYAAAMAIRDRASTSNVVLSRERRRWPE